MPKMCHSTQWMCVLFCALGMVGMGSTNANDVGLPMKFLTDAADPKTPLALPYFLDEIRKTAGDSTTKTTTRNTHRLADIHGSEKTRLLATKAHHLSQMFDLHTSPTIIRRFQEWGTHNARKPNIYQSSKKYNRDVVPKPYYKVYIPNPRSNTKWEPSVYTPNKPQANTNQYQYKKPINERERQPINIYNQQYKHNLRSRVPEALSFEQVDYKPTKLSKRKESKREDDEQKDDDSDEDKDEKDFVPTRMYAQVRQFETQSHLPRNEEEPKLKKIVKDSRIHTVYMEEGYEDGAYDHAGEEKHAEEEEAQVEHRRRRRHIDASLTNVEIDTDLIGKNQFVLGDRNNKVDKKYPYYEKKNINSDSPLRYAQDMDSIPRKKEGDMTFYEESHKRTKCEEVIDNVAPIPKDLDSGDESPEKTIVPKLPRLKKLGDKIDCFKIKFFGEEPFDNPLFQEKLVGSPKQLFTDPDVILIENNLKLINRTGKTFQPLAVEASGYPTSGKVMEEYHENSQSVLDPDTAATDGKEQAIDELEFQPLPEAEALYMRRVTRRRQRPYQNKLYSDRFTAYRPKNRKTPPHNLLPRTTPPTVPSLPNVISEVYYKDQIKPNEQLNVFADVINHIQNMSRVDSDTASSAQKPHTVSVLPLKSKPHPPTLNMKLRTAQRKKLKRKYPVMKSTQQLYTDFMHRKKNNPSRQSDISTAQESAVNVGTVQIPSLYGSVDLSPFKNNAEVTGQYTTIDLPLNKYLVPGMKPPLVIEKPMIYSDFQSDNILKRKDWLSNHRISRRKRATRNYSEIRRPPASRPKETEDEEEDDDYVPHRPTNYHYDPDTDRIIYDKAPTTDKSVEEIVEEYFEEEQDEPEEVTTKKAPVLHRTVYHKDVFNTDKGKTFIDFLAQLKSDPSYKLIDDPEPTTATTTTTSKPGSTTPPEFLKFLEKLHSNDGYKKINNPEDIPTTKKPKTTTEAIVEEEEEVEEESMQAGSIQNSPGGQFSQDGALQIFDINDYLPKVKTYTPRTSINYSKYKTIERTTSRHTLSSRYNAEDEDQHTSTTASVASRYQTAPPRPKPAILQNDDDKEQVKVEELSHDDVGVETVSEPSSTSSTTTTSAPKIRVRGRRPSRRPSTTTLKPQDDAITIAAIENYTPATHRPPSRVYPRRQHPKIRLRSTTTASSISNGNDNGEQSSETAKTIRRRNGVPANHKPDYTPVTISKRMDDYPTMIVQRQARLVTPEIINYNQTASSMISRIGVINPRQQRKQYKITLLTTQMAPTETDKVTSAEKINIDDSNSQRRNGNTDRSDNIVAMEGVKFIKDPNKRLYFYAPS